MTGFVHLRVHTEYSLVDSVVRVDPLVETLDKLGMPACAITDQGNVSALVKFYRAAFDRGIKPLIGADVWVAESADDRDPTRLTLLCQNRLGFKRLSALLTRSAAGGSVAGRNVVLKDWLTVGALEQPAIRCPVRCAHGRALCERNIYRQRMHLLHFAQRKHGIRPADRSRGINTITRLKLSYI